MLLELVFTITQNVPSVFLPTATPRTRVENYSKPLVLLYLTIPGGWKT